jgi:hypothetical protein
MKPKDIFVLAVRLLGLLFLYLGLKAVTPLLGLEVIENPDKNEIIDDLLPVIFNLLVAWWLLSSRLLVRRAYPETSKASDALPAPVRKVTPWQEPIPSAVPNGMDRAEEKLASLVEKSKQSKAA